ncbi:restriction endonuclease subunit S [Streptomyces sp. BK022]|uniref:restriction endonuclease subunit S n=1 Tax=Streptomyces sp. BK022 TaxID=2512123 RepID=UPI002414FCC8|nr:restriction endonuclease subunit S [Streptomyces sp. BK022]
MRVNLDEIAEVQGGIQKQQKRRPVDNKFPFLRVANVGSGSLDLREVHEVELFDGELERFVLRPGDLLVVEGNGSVSQLGRAARWGGEIENCVHQNHLIRVRPGPAISAKFLELLWNSPEVSAQLRSVAASTSGLHTLSTAKLKRVSIPLPPLEEQRRIVAALEEHLVQMARAEGLLQVNLRKLSAYGERLLLQACNGHLLGLPPATGQPVPPAADCVDGELPALPAGWIWGRLGEVADVVGGITKDAKKQSDPKLPEVPYLRVANVQRGHLNLATIATIRTSHEKISALTLQAGDVLLNEGGDRDKLGRGWIWEGQIESCIHQNHVFRARVRNGLLDPKILAWHANSFGRRWFEVNGKQSVNLASISLRKIKQFPVPIPPSDLQKQIVQEVERQLSVVEKTETAVRAALARGTVLRRSLLAEAFAGRLVPQDPADRSADALLDDIRVEREAAGAAKPRRRSPRRAPAQHQRTPDAAPMPDAPPPPTDVPTLATATQPTLDMEIPS